MIQEIITYIILIATAFYIAFKLFYKKAAQKNSSCGGCESSCSGCELTDLKHQIEVARKKKNSVYNSIREKKSFGNEPLGTTLRRR